LTTVSSTSKHGQPRTPMASPRSTTNRTTSSPLSRPRSGASASSGHPGTRAFLTLALSSREPELRRALEVTNFARSAYLEFDIAGLPEEHVAVFVWPEPLGHPTHIGIDVVCLGTQPLAVPLTLQLALTDPPKRTHAVADAVVSVAELDPDLDETRPDTLRYGGAEWRLCAKAGIQQEVTDLDEHGGPVFQAVDTAVYCYQLCCPKCGRIRYARRNSTHQIKYCRVCTRAAQLRRRALSQFQHRHTPNTKSRRLRPDLVDKAVELYVTGATITEVARTFGVTASGMTRILQRRGVWSRR